MTAELLVTASVAKSLVSKTKMVWLTDDEKSLIRLDLVMP